MRNVVRRFAVGALVTSMAATITALIAPAAVAHNVLIESTPDDGSAVSAAPETIELVFDQPVQNEFPQVAVIDAGENHYEQGDPEIVGETVTQAVNDLPNGEYTVSYRVLSADGHPVDGSIQFTVGAADDDQSSASESTAADDTGGDISGGVLLGIATLALAGLAALVIVTGKRRNSTDTPS